MLLEFVRRFFLHFNDGTVAGLCLFAIVWAEMLRWNDCLFVFIYSSAFYVGEVWLGWDIFLAEIHYRVSYKIWHKGQNFRPDLLVGSFLCHFKTWLLAKENQTLFYEKNTRHAHLIVIFLYKWWPICSFNADFFFFFELD